MNCLVIPTYPPHFLYVKKLLESIDNYNLDTNKTNIYITINKIDNIQLSNTILNNF